jgi:hypothetical protein
MLLLHPIANNLLRQTIPARLIFFLSHIFLERGDLRQMPKVLKARLDKSRRCSYFVLPIARPQMAAIETLGDAYAARWSVRMRCGRGDHRGIVRIDVCNYQGALDMETLVCTRGRAFPLARLASRLRCPNCGEWNVHILFDVPGSALPIFVPQSPYKRQA